MVPEHVIKSLSIKNDAKIVLLVIDGLAGLPINGRTELEAADTPNLDRLVTDGVTGHVHAVARGITPGSGPGHLALFGYDPFKYEIGRGVLEALGVGLEMGPNDVASRGNFATMNAKGIITDRRAGRIASEKSKELCQFLSKDTSEVGGAKVTIVPGKEHRFTILFRREELDGRIADADPQKNGLPHQPAVALVKEAEATAALINQFIERANRTLSHHSPANTILLRGFAKYPHIPSMQELYKLNPAAIAAYPMYRGLARLVGMQVLDAGDKWDTEIECLRSNFSKHDFFFVHYKYTDSRGEDGDFDAKVAALEDVDRLVPAILSMEPDVIAVTGDHATPSLLKGHSWHPNPLVLWSKYVRADQVTHFNEVECARGALGTLMAVDIMPMLLAHALKLEKFGA
jgi:2,3-bisphosphoglycerate-independent phosphoglycerate mutase